MPTRRIADAPPPPCLNPDHDPPKFASLPPETYEHACPSCGRRVVFSVTRPIW